MGRKGGMERGWNGMEWDRMRWDGMEWEGREEIRPLNCCRLRFKCVRRCSSEKLAASGESSMLARERKSLSWLCVAGGGRVKEGSKKSSGRRVKEGRKEGRRAREGRKENKRRKEWRRVQEGRKEGRRVKEGRKVQEGE